MAKADLVEKLNEANISLEGLSEEEKQQRMGEFLGSLSEEELNELKKEQCVFCAIAEGKIESISVYEDNLVKAVLDIKPANKGHIIVFPKEHISLMSMMNDKLTAHIFNVANMLGKAVFEAVKAKGTNVYIANGKAAGQFVDHFLVHIIPRFEKDKVAFSWPGEKVNENEMKEIASNIKSRVVRKDAEKKEEFKEAKIETVSISKKRLP